MLILCWLYFYLHYKVWWTYCKFCIMLTNKNWNFEKVFCTIYFNFFWCLSRTSNSTHHVKNKQRINNNKQFQNKMKQTNKNNIGKWHTVMLFQSVQRHCASNMHFSQKRSYHWLVCEMYVCVYLRYVKHVTKSSQMHLCHSILMHICALDITQLYLQICQLFHLLLLYIGINRDTYII